MAALRTEEMSGNLQEVSVNVRLLIHTQSV